MLSKREIIKKVMIETELPNSPPKEELEKNFNDMCEHPEGKAVLGAYEEMMDQYAEQEALAFMTWKEQNRNKYTGNDADLYKNHFKLTRNPIA